MSYILEALKKSEAERRQRDAGADGDSRWDAPAAVTDRRGLYLLLGVALVVVALLLWNIVSLTSSDDTGSESRIYDDEQSVTLPSAAQSAGQSSSAIKIPAPDTEAHQLVVPQQPVLVETPAEQGSVASATESAQADLRQTESQPAATGFQSEAARRAMPPVSALKRIPQLMINSHIYSPVADKRSVIMNNQQWHEGDVIADGVYLKEITADGIMLDVEGWPVHVGRSKGWQAIPGSD